MREKQMSWELSYSTLFHKYRLTKYQLMEIIGVSEASIKKWHSIVLESEKDDFDLDILKKGPLDVNKIRIIKIAEFLINPKEAISKELKHRQSISSFETIKLVELSLIVANLELLYCVGEGKITHEIEISKTITELLYTVIKEYCILMFNWEYDENDCGPLTY